MRVDVSEIKTFKSCRRQWQLSSRNKFHMRPIVTPPQFALGTIFHESLAQLYLGVPYEKVMEMVRREMQTDNDAALLAMIPGYYKNVLPSDLDRFKVLDIEHHFEIAPKTSDGEYLFPLEPLVNKSTGEVQYDANGDPIMVSSLLVCGSIDMIVLDEAQNKIYGFEHKTCKSFRDESYLWMDEQPRVYTWALKEYVEEYNAKHGTNYELGGVYLNEVKKLLRNFQYQRTLCMYTDEDLDNFMRSFFEDCLSCKHAVDNNSYAAPKPSYFNCNMCSFKTICTTYMYANLDKDAVLDEFKEEFVERTEDHLEEKAERSTEEK
uniref:PD-(D/E)XK nuclease superfamily protein n=1 Tax=Myoviridae sp. ct4uh47 TaxID=2825032 RepID=A0A8S5V5P4_9CAUD|nr:MAG TPA: PD-(D/E)XK nuclease superfamily protein [Myoviridae sp. ct4uh47]